MTLDDELARLREEVAAWKARAEMAQGALDALLDEHDTLAAEHEQMLCLLIERQANSRVRAEVTNRKHWRRSFGVDDLPAAIRRAHFALDFPRFREPRAAWTQIASGYRPAAGKRRPYREIVEALLERLKDGSEGAKAAAMHRGVPLEEFLREVDKGAVAAALR